MKLLVIGGTRFIRLTTVRRAVELGHDGQCYIGVNMRLEGQKDGNSEHD